MKKEWTLTEDSFHKLLNWLHTDKDRAGEKYEKIRQRLIKIFARRGCAHAEDLADETMDRVIRKLDDVLPNYIGEPDLYFYGVAQNIYLEYIKKATLSLPLPAGDSPARKEQRYNCLECCLKELPPETRELVIEYYEDEGHAKIEHRKQMAERLGIEPHVLRVRISRIKSSLGKCVRDCMKKVEEE